MTSDDPKVVAYEVESLRKLAFFGIAISTVATLTAIIAVPMLYNYMQHVQSSLQTEVDFCRHRTDGLWDEYGRMTSDDPKVVAYEVESLRKLAFFGIAISTVATLTAIIAVPMLYNYMQHVQSSLQTEVDFCRHRTDGLWDEYGRVSSSKFTLNLRSQKLGKSFKSFLFAFQTTKINKQLTPMFPRSEYLNDVSGFRMRFEHLKGVNGRIKRAVVHRGNGVTGRATHRRAVAHGASSYDGGYGASGYEAG
ncbi:unnamed protein product, partial [Strongylus vulgaris]